VRVALINEGIYPYRPGAVGIWCQRLVRGLAEHEYQIVALVDSVTESLYPPRASTPNLTTLRVDGPPVGPPPGGHISDERRLATHAAMLLCRGMLDDEPHSAAMFRAGLERIVAQAADGTNPMAGISLPSIVLDGWATARAATIRAEKAAKALAALPPPDAQTGPAAPPPQPRPANPANTPGSVTRSVSAALPAPPLPPLPKPTMSAARAVAALLDLAVRPLTAGLPAIDLCHTVNCGLSTMVALAAKWRSGTPFVITEHSGYLSDPLLRRARTDPAVHALILRFLRALTRLAYQEAAAIVPPSERMRRWALDHGAPRERITMIPPGIDPRDNPPLREEPAEPVVAWVGPDRERELAFAAFELVRREVPEARLIVIGHPPDGTRPVGVSFTGPVGDRRALYGMAQVIAVSGNDAAMPYPLIEAMMCGRPTVCTESGGLAEMVGIGASVVPQSDPEPLGRACVALLDDERLRREMSNSARQRSRTLFSLRTMLDGYQRVYGQAAQVPQPSTELALTP
jgi:polysaccharide biosynthesis protein PelF